MAKRIKFESFKYRFLVAAKKITYDNEVLRNYSWEAFLNDLEFKDMGRNIEIAWVLPALGCMTISLDEPCFYLRGDREKDIEHQAKNGLLVSDDPVKQKNGKYFEEIVGQLAELAGYSKSVACPAAEERIQNERQFHDAWANSEDVRKIDVRASNEVCTAPEMRFIVQSLGDLKGKRLLDVGCGLGEASVYFAMLGADVTSLDLSPGMLDATSRLAQANGVSVKRHIASAEDMQLPSDAKFDIIYAGNLLHHVNIEDTIIRILPHLAPGGVFVSWDPLAYNPAINVYRAIASAVRTSDEHPLKWCDIKLFHKYFVSVEKRYFWFTTLIIFIVMALLQRRNPNKERFWKVVVQEGEKWAWLYRPLEKIDQLLLFLFPPLRILCWNIVVICKISH